MFDFSKLKQIRWQDWLVRFCFGGAVSLLAGLFAHFKHVSLAGLFLAFPAIFPAGIGLVERELKKQCEEDKNSSPDCVAKPMRVYTRGAIFGGFGLAAFALAVVMVSPRSPILALIAGCISWAGMAAILLGIQKAFTRQGAG